MTIKLSITRYDNKNHWLYGETNNGKLYVFVDEWREDNKCFYPVLYICNRENRPYIPLYVENYEIGCGFNHMWGKPVVERFPSTHALYSAILEYSKK